MSTRRSYDVIADAYARELSAELDGKVLDRALLAAVVELAGGGLVADLGCGPGHVTAHLAGVGAHAIGLDLSPGMCAVGARDAGLPFAAGDLRALPLRDAGLAAVVCLYAVIHLDEDGRATAYREIARVLRPGGVALVAFHVSDDSFATGGSDFVTDLWGRPVELTFRYLDPAAEVAAATATGLTCAARLDRAPVPGAEHPSRRSYLLLTRA